MSGKISQRCSAPNCQSVYYLYKTGSSYRNKRFFKVTVNREILWVDSVRKLCKPDFNFTYKNSYFCEDHFELKCFKNNKKNSLNSNAVPTIFCGSNTSSSPFNDAQRSKCETVTSDDVSKPSFKKLKYTCSKLQVIRKYQTSIDDFSEVPFQIPKSTYSKLASVNTTASTITDIDVNSKPDEGCGILTNPIFDTGAVVEDTSKLDPRQETLRNKLYQEMNTRNMESHKRNNLLLNEDEKEPNTVVIEESDSESSEWSFSEEEDIKPSVLPKVLPKVSPHNSENEFSSAEFNDENMSSSVSDNDDKEGSLDKNMRSSELSFSELPPVKNIKPSVLPKVLPKVLPNNSENEFSPAEFNDENVSSSASENDDKEGSLDKNMSRINYPSDDIDGAFIAKMDCEMSEKTIADLRQEVKNLQIENHALTKKVKNYEKSQKTIVCLRKKMKSLHRQNRTLTKKVHCLKSFFCYLEKNNFLNRYAGAAVKAVMSGRTEPP